MKNPLENFENPWDAEGEYAQSFLNVDDVLDTSKLFDSEKAESNQQKVPKKTFYINVVMLPKAEQNSNFNINQAISIANHVLNHYISGYAHLYNNIQFRKYNDSPKQMKNCIIIGQDNIELASEILKYTHQIFFTICGSMLKINSNLDEIDVNGNVITERWYPETSSTGHQGGIDNHGVIRLDHLEYKNKLKSINPLTHEIPYTHNINLAFVLLHIIGHNAMRTSHGPDDTGIMSSGGSLGTLLKDINTELQEEMTPSKWFIQDENPQYISPMLAMLQDKPSNLEYLKITPMSSCVIRDTKENWIEQYGYNGKYIYGIFKLFKPQ